MDILVFPYEGFSFINMWSKTTRTTLKPEMTLIMHVIQLLSEMAHGIRK